jgi:hypothetical protein
MPRRGAAATRRARSRSVSNLGDAVQGERGSPTVAPVNGPVAPTVVPASNPDAPATEPPPARPTALHEVARLVAPGTPAEVIGLALALLVAVLGQQLLGQRPLVVPVLGACVLALLAVRVLTRPPRPAPLRRPPAASSEPAPARATDAFAVSEAISRASLPAMTTGAAEPPAAAPVLPAASAPPAVTSAPPEAAVAPGRARQIGLLLGATRSEWLLRAAFLLGALVWVQMRGRPANADYTLVVLTWLAAIAVAALVAAPWPLPGPRQSAAVLGALPRTDWLLLGGVTLAALLLRAVWINHVPYVFSGDEGSQALAAVDVLQGTLRNPFGTGWLALPTLFFFWQADFMAFLGQNVAGARMLSAILGTLAVVFTYLLARRLFGRTVALTAAVLLAVYHYHVLYSRVATVPIGDPLLVVAALFFLDRAVVERRPLDALAAGLVVGLGEYFTPVAGRVLPLLAVANLLYAALWDAERLRPRLPRRADWLSLAPLAGWIVLGALLVYLPLLAHYADFPAEYAARGEQASIFQSGLLAREQATGKSAVDVVVQHVQHAALLPLTASPTGWYMGITPTTGVPLALLPAIGLALVTFGAWRRRYFGLAVAYWAIVIALSLTDDPAQPQRSVIITSVVALLAALGICAPLRFAAWLGDLPRTVTGAAIAVALVALGFWNFQSVFRNPDPIAYYGTENGLVATELAYYARALGPGATVYLFGAPRVFYHGFATVPFIAPNATGVDVERPLDPGAAPLAVKGPTAFAFLPERLGELAQVRAWYPTGTVQEIRSPKDAPVLTVYRVNGS